MARRKKCLNIFVSLLVMVCMAGCSIDGIAVRKGRISKENLIESLSPVIEAHKGVISENLDMEIDLSQYSGEEIICKALEEEQGTKILEFCYAIEQTSDPDEVLYRAQKLLPPDQYQELKDKADDIENKIKTGQLEFGKGLPASQREAFTKDLKKLLVKTIVLLTAGIVYACMPDVMLWGKIGAAAGIAIAAGATAVTVMSIYEQFQFGHDVDQSFKDWLEDVITLPQAEYAIAASMIAMGSTLKQGPVISGIVLCIYGLYQAVDMLRPMLQIYNFEV